MTSTLHGVVGQRLVRVLCPACREPYRAAPELVERLRLDRFAAGPEVTLHRPKGCEACDHTGYSGRCGIFEVLALDEDIARMVLRKADTGQIRATAVAHGMRTMDEDGLAKAIAGTTTVDEILRVTRVA
jgi:general secretion pathway protein E